VLVNRISREAERLAWTAEVAAGRVEEMIGGAV
jgi:hypothetical protein